MPFTFGGDFFEKSVQPQKPDKPLKVSKEKRKQKIVTLIANFSRDKDELKKLSSKLKTHFGCGGCVKGEIVEIQGDKVEEVKKFLSTYKA